MHLLKELRTWPSKQKSNMEHSRVAQHRHFSKLVYLAIYLGKYKNNCYRYNSILSNRRILIIQHTSECGLRCRTGGQAYSRQVTMKVGNSKIETRLRKKYMKNFFSLKEVTLFKKTYFSFWILFLRYWISLLRYVPGIERVIKGKRQYAFLMESTTIEYKMERNCDIMKVGGLIDNKGYGIAMPRSNYYIISPYI